jgi:hypothetical protein
MDNPFVNTSITVDYMAILEALEAQTNSADRRWRKLSNAAGGQIIAEYRTIGFKVARQCGKSTAMGRWLSKASDKTLCVFTNNNLRDAIVRNWAGRLGESVRVVSVLPSDLRKFIRKENPIKYDAQSVFPDGVKYILVDDADAIFNYFGIRLKEFNQWVHDTFGPDVLVIHFG